MNKHRWFYSLMALVMVVTPLLSPLGARVALAQEPDHTELAIDFDAVFSVPDQYRDTIAETMEVYDNLLPPDVTDFAVSAMEESGAWTHFTVVPSVVVKSGWMIPLPDEQIVEIVVVQEKDRQIGYVISEANEEVSRLIPELGTLSSDQVTSEAFLFPWASPQKWRKTQGWHDGNSIDFAPVNHSHPSVNFAVFASRSGRVTRVCNDGYQSILRIQHSGNLSTRYLHLATTSVPGRILNHNVARGQFLGLIYNGTAHINGYCRGRGFQYNTRCGCGTGPHLHFETSSRQITIDGHKINNVANAPNYTQFRSSNHRIDYGDHTKPHTDITINNLTPNEWPTWFDGPVSVHLHATDRGGSGVKEIHYQLDEAGWQTQSGHDLPLSVSADGQHTLQYYAKDKAGNQEGAHTVHFNLDTTPPSAPGVIVESHGVTPGVWQTAVNDPAFTWDAAGDAASGVQYYRIEWGTASAFAASPSYDPPPVPTGNYLLTVRAVDNAGHVGPASSFLFTYDGTPPHAPEIQNLDGVASGVWQNQVRVPRFSWPTPSDEGSGVVGVYLYWGPDENGTSSVLTTTNTFALNTPICDADDAASYYLRMRSQDGVGLQSDWVPFAFRYDGAPPVADLTANYGQDVVHQTMVHLDIDTSDLGSGVSGIRFSNEGRVWSDWLEPVDEMTWEIPAVGQRGYDIYLQARDQAGNVSEIVSDTVYLNVNVPRPHSESYDLWNSAFVAGGRTSTSTLHTLNTTVQWHDAPASVGQQYQMVSGFQAGSQAAPTVVPTATQQYVQVGSLIASGGTGALPLQSANYQMHGSLGQPSDMQVITGTQYVASLGYWGGAAADVETEGPPPPPPPPPPECEFYSISINDGALYTNRPDVTLNLCGPDAEEMMLSNDGGFSNAAWQVYTRTISWTLTTYGNYVLPRYVYARFQGSDGNIHGTFFDDIIYDPYAPDNAVAFNPTQLLPGTNRLASVGALQVVNSDHVDLFVSASDDNSGLSEVQVSLSPDFSGAEWQPFSAIMPITFTDEGLQTVYVRTRDQAQNESQAASASVIVDRTPPTATVRMREEIVGADALSVTMLVTATDALGEVTAMRIGATPALTDAIWVTYTSPITLYGDYTDELTPTVYVQLRDEAGNVSSVYSTTYALDVTPPWGTVEVESRGETTATLRFDVEDDLSGVAELLLSPDPWFLENVTRLPYQEQLVWDFGDDNEVYVLFEDGVGNWSESHWVPLRAVSAMTITKSVAPTGTVSYGDELTYTLVISSAPGEELGIYDPLEGLSFARFVEPVPDGVVYADGVITGSLTVTPTTPVTVSFVTQVGVPGTVGWEMDVSNEACVYPVFSTLYNCTWSNVVTNTATHMSFYDVYLPLVLRNR